MRLTVKGADYITVPARQRFARLFQLLRSPAPLNLSLSGRTPSRPSSAHQSNRWNPKFARAESGRKDRPTICSVMVAIGVRNYGLNETTTGNCTGGVWGLYFVVIVREGIWRFNVYKANVFAKGIALCADEASTQIRYKTLGWPFDNLPKQDY